MNGVPHESEEIRGTLNRSAIVVKTKQPFLDWLHTADPTSRRLTLGDLLRATRIYLIPECDTEEDVGEVLQELSEDFRSSNWRVGSGIQQLGLRTVVSMSFVAGSTTSTIRC
jgi:hypothetical protein